MFKLRKICHRANAFMFFLRKEAFSASRLTFHLSKSNKQMGHIDAVNISPK